MAVEQSVVGRHRAATDERTKQLRRVAAPREDLGSVEARHRAPVTGTISPDGDAAGEERVGQVLDRLARRGLRVLHDRRVPGSRANIDHLVVTPSAVWVVDAKRYKGRPRRVTPGGRLRPRVERLEVGRRDRTRLVEGVLAQAALVSDVVGDDVPVRAALCFVDADWPLLGSDFVVRDVLVTWPRRLSSVLSDELDGSALDLAAVHQRLNVAFRVA